MNKIPQLANDVIRKQFKRRLSPTNRQQFIYLLRQNTQKQLNNATFIEMVHNSPIGPTDLGWR